ncbi:probable calcium-binding protein CML18 [Zingiber officinale]|uniref:EF-hand domain-containing protein n=1 Tax=Zingiber officinale TaxID=94328 RepID=A0A8J5KUD9_ZINOF|nr:probable calcium-binding protein CML18 [Zingiber officinale]KAG6496449.1 hypothetical protein ZIOFF_044316 [Zingiber officinale]
MAADAQRSLRSSPSFGLHRMDKIEKVFDRYNANGDDRISASELDDILRALGSTASPAEIRDMIAEMDTDGDGFVDLQELVDFHRRGVGCAGVDKELREAFDVYDPDGNRLISAEELHRVLKQLGEKCSVKDCTRMIGSVDEDGDGNVNFEEFKRMMAKGGVGRR